MMPLLVKFAAVLSLVTPIQSIDPAHAANMTIYHIAQKRFGPKPVNMNSGDAAGDMYFDLSHVILFPLECPGGPGSTPQCAGVEEGQNVVVNKVILEVDTRYTGYSRCNVGTNGTDGHGHACKNDTYCCYCSVSQENAACNNSVGVENVLETHASRGCTKSMPEWECMKNNVAKKFSKQTPGYWYSSLDRGYCDSPSAEDCTWKVVSIPKIVNRTCHNLAFYGAVEKEGQTCFDACGAKASHNSTSPCWVKCFFNTVLGPDGSKPGGRVTGMPMQSLIDAWLSAFMSDDPAKGGCPNLAESESARASLVI